MVQFVKNLSVLAVAACVVAASSPSQAAVSGDAKVLNVSYSTEWNGSAGELGIYLANGQTYYADPGTSPGCGITAPSVDTARQWATLAQAALLSGKKVNISYSDCDSYHWILSVTIVA